MPSPSKFPNVWEFAANKKITPLQAKTCKGVMSYFLLLMVLICSKVCRSLSKPNMAA